MAELVCKDAILREGNFRNREFQRAVVRYCSVLQTNLAYTVIREGEEFTGNGWKGCNFFGASCSAMRVERDCFEQCSMGNMNLLSLQLLDTVFYDCGYMGSRLEHLQAEGCRFDRCNFRKVQITDAVVRKTVFTGCLFDGTVLEGVSLSGVSFQNCTFRGGRMELKGKYKLRRCSFE